MNFIKLNQIFLPVSNLSKSKKWYMEHFNLRESTGGTVDQNIMVELSFERTSFWLVKHVPLNKYTHIPFNFHTNQLKDIHEELFSKGVNVTDITSDGECFDFYDPEGNRIGFCYESNSRNQRHIEVGGTFLTVRNLTKAIQWYREKLGYDFDLFDATGGAGVIGPKLEFIPELTIHYAGVSNKSFQCEWSRISLVETPQYNSLSYKPYNILSSNIQDDHDILRARNVTVSDIYNVGSQHRFSFYDIDGNRIEIVEE